MTTQSTAPQSEARPRAGRTHFIVAAAILAISAGGFHTAVWGLGVVLVKEPVPWPKDVAVDQYRLTSFPFELGRGEDEGRYQLIGLDKIKRDENGNPVKGAVPEGVHVQREETIGEMDISNHPLNWYYTAVYRDTKSPQVFVLQLTYYTGLLDAVPHVPTACIDAAGDQILSARSRVVSMTIPEAASPWRTFGVNRVAYARGGDSGRGREMAEYYVFSMNGEPTADRYYVRGKLTLPWVKYCYYAKIQVAPKLPETSLEKMDEACQDFLRCAMPEILRFLPSAEVVRRLHESDPSGESEIQEE